jgi:hypothetical protein
MSCARMMAAVSAMWMATSCASVPLGSLEGATFFGSYKGRVVAEWLEDGRFMRLVEPFSFSDWRGVVWDAPAGSKVDGASIPRLGWTAVGGPFEGTYRDASVIHDVACVRKDRPWKETHLAFYAGMRASGVPAGKAKRMFAAVYHFGPEWPLPGHPGRDGRILEMDLQFLQTEIERPLSEEPTIFDEMTLDDIMAFGRDRFEEYRKTDELPRGSPVPKKKP